MSHNQATGMMADELRSFPDDGQAVPRQCLLPYPLESHPPAVHFADVLACHTPPMTDVAQNPDITHERGRTGLSADALRRGVVDHLRYSIGRPAAALTPEHFYRATALAVRDRMQDNRVVSTQTSLDLGRKVTCYLSAEFLMGPQLGANLLNLGIEGAARSAALRVRWDRTSMRCWAARRSRGWATVVSAGWPRATSTRWPPSSARPSATESATSSASSTRRSTTAGRSRRPTTGSSTATRGKPQSPMSTTG